MTEIEKTSMCVCLCGRERDTETEKMSMCERDTVRQRKTENHREKANYEWCGIFNPHCPPLVVYL